MELKQTNNQQQIIEILKIFETLLSIVDSTLRMFQPSKLNKLDFYFYFYFIGIHLASIIIPLFINFLPDSTSSNFKINIHLISYIIERIQYLLPIYSDEFRLIFQTLPDLRPKLENAIHHQQQKRNEKELNQLAKNSVSSSRTKSQTPSIPLRIDFSNFKSHN
jgi:hypothetical protein